MSIIYFLFALSSLENNSIYIEWNGRTIRLKILDIIYILPYVVHKIKGFTPFSWNVKVNYIVQLADFENTDIRWKICRVENLY
jgi:hypothetical protein